MSTVDLERLRIAALQQPGARERVSGIIKFQCPQCALEGHDEHQDNAGLFLNEGKWGCAFASGAALGRLHWDAIGRQLGALTPPRTSTSTTTTPATTNIMAAPWTRLSTIDMKSITFLDRPFLQESAFHLLAGRKGVGKGTVLASIAARFTRGQLGSKRTVIWIGSEDAMDIDVRPRIEAAGGDANFVIVPKAFYPRLPEDLPALRTMITDVTGEVGPLGGLIVDPLANHLGAGKNSNSDLDVREAIGPLNQLAEDYATVVIGVRHFTEKEVSHGLLAAIMGASAWVQVPRVVIGIAEDPADSTIRYMQAVAGNRAPRSAPSRKFQIIGVRLPGLAEEVTRAEWLGDSEQNLEGLLTQTPGGDGTKSARGRNLILDLLEVKEWESDALDAHVAQQIGITAKTVRNLRGELTTAGLIKAYKPLGDERSPWMVRRTHAPRPEPTR